MTGGWRKLHKEELRDLYSSPSIISIIKSRRMRWAGHVARMGEKRNVYRLLEGKPEGKRPIGRPRRRWVDIKMNPLEIGWGGMDNIRLAGKLSSKEWKRNCFLWWQSISNLRKPEILHNRLSVLLLVGIQGAWRLGAGRSSEASGRDKL
jgi:hypothetical protein